MEIFGEQFQNVLIVILLVATVLSAFLGHATEAVAIGVIVLFAVLLGFVQEYRAERTIQALRQMAAPLATVVREGRELSIPARDLVPGDVISLRTGDRIPADARLFEAVNLRLEEAVLTGESVAVEKQTDLLASEDLSLGDRTNMAYAGTAATYGRGRALVVATGMQTEFGRHRATCRPMLDRTSNRGQRGSHAVRSLQQFQRVLSTRGPATETKARTSKFGSIPEPLSRVIAPHGGHR